VWFCGGATAYEEIEPSCHVMFDLRDQEHLEHINERSSGNVVFEELFLNFQYQGEWISGLFR
jgi:hypothetical protein